MPKDNLSTYMITGCHLININRLNPNIRKTTYFVSQFWKCQMKQKIKKVK